jgi:hypothetical protein
MEVSHSDALLQSPAMQALEQFIQAQPDAWKKQVPEYERFEQALHTLVMAVECECLKAELQRYDVVAAEVEVGGTCYRPALTSPETYLTAAGPVTVERHLYRPAGRSSKSICPLELRAGIVAGAFTPRAARQAAFVMAHLTSGDSEKLFAELGSMQPSRSHLDRLPKVLSPHWESHRLEWEAVLRAQETVPVEAAVLALSVDGVMAPMKGGYNAEHRAQPGKHASGPTGNREVGCGTVVLYDVAGERLQTVRYGRMPEHKKVSLQQQLAAEAASIMALRPDLTRVRLADGAEDNWRLLAEVERTLPATAQPSPEIVDFYHACDHLKNGCDAAWGESTARGQAEFERLKTLLKEADDGAERVIRALTYQRGRARGRKRERLEAEVTYFRNQRPRMHYADYRRRNWPIASGVMEASCKTLVTQRLKCSGMAWTRAGGQAILTLRSLIQSERWSSAWELLSADFRPTLVVHHTPCGLPATMPIERTVARYVNHADYSTLPLAA